MTLCNLCKGIPWETIPSVPPDLDIELSGYPYLQPFYRWPEDIRGYSHHQSLEALRNSATVLNCHLCRLILKQVQSCQSELEELKPKWEADTMTRYDWPLWELWIVKRENGGDGFWVMSLTDGAEKKEVRLVAAIGLCVRDGDPLESIIRGRPVEQHGGTLTAISRARKWLKECNEHPSCSPGETQLPSRVIDVGVDTNSPHVKLRETEEHERGKYISLSYCWGNEQACTTTQATLADRKRQIMISDLPKTHQDAIKLARELGVRYLWIDSICICQDDHENWERESAKMLSIYCNAYLTVAASRAKDTSEGLFGERPTREYVELRYTSGDLRGQALAFNLPLHEEAISSDYLSLPDEPLSDRAWGLQERVLSRRMLLYGTQQLFFECNEGFRGEDGVSLKDRFNSVHQKLGEESEEMEQHQKEANCEDEKISNNKAALLGSWYSLLWLYGPRKLTNASDKLPAMSGLASVFAKRLDDEYVAGLWRSHLIEGLLWQGLRCRRVPEYRSPSWSWASMDGIPGLGVEQDYDTLAKVLDVKVNLKGANPYGEVTDARIRIRAPMERLYLAIEDWDPNKAGFPYDNNPKVRTANGKPEGTHSRFDFDFTAEDAPQEALKIVKSLEGVEIFALILLKVTEESYDDQYQGLIVTKVKGGEEYQRLGFIFLDEETLGRRLEEQAEEEVPIVTLV
ncbi:HET domain-containing protein [Fusarium sp. Ph1]|nr:HET domain-containing protein [Fusarium sp. Ph1]